MKAIFTAKQTSAYDDLPEVRYHFPRTYLRQVEQSVGDLIIYYEPRRTSTELDSRGGRQAYFAVARVERVEADPSRSGHYYAHVGDYIDFHQTVRFSSGGFYYESALSKGDGSTNKGAFGRAVRLISDEEFELILAAGFADAAEAGLAPSSAWGLAEGSANFERPVNTSIVTRPYRDRAFVRHIQAAYEGRCAVTGIRMVNGGGRVEAEAAHIQPVAADGPDSIRNGIALSGTVHWMFDRGLISVDDDYRLLKARRQIPEGIERLFLPTGKLLTPEPDHLRPHAHFLRYHRENVFKG